MRKVLLFGLLLFGSVGLAGSISSELYQQLLPYGIQPDISVPYHVLRLAKVVCNMDPKDEVECVIQRSAEALSAVIVGSEAASLFATLKKAGLLYEGASGFSRVSAYSLACLHTIDGIEDWYDCQAVRPLEGAQTHPILYPDRN